MESYARTESGKFQVVRWADGTGWGFQPSPYLSPGEKYSATYASEDEALGEAEAWESEQGE